MEMKATETMYADECNCLCGCVQNEIYYWNLLVIKVAQFLSVGLWNV